MSGASRNQGVQIIASFDDRAIPLNAPAGTDETSRASCSVNKGIRLLADFEDDAQPLNGSEIGTLDTLNVLLAQHERKVQRLVNELQGMIEELKKQNATLQGILRNKDQLINRYYLDGPSEDEI
jgi:hypothetical protein